MQNMQRLLILIALFVFHGFIFSGDQQGRAPEEWIQFGILCDSGLSLAADGQYESALHLFDSLIKIHPKYEELLRIRGLVYCRLGNYEKALKSYPKSKSLDAKYQDRLDRGLIYARLEKYSDAAKEFSNAAKAENQESVKHRALFNLGVAYEKVGKYNKALKAYNSLLSSFSGSDEKTLAIVKERIDDLKAAIKAKTSLPGVERLDFQDDLDSRLLEMKKDYPVIVKYPVQVYEELPEYPSRAADASKEGYVIVNAYVNEFGKVTSAEAIRCSDYTFGFEEAAVKAAYKCRYEPAQDINGKPVGIWIEYKVNFKL